MKTLDMNYIPPERDPRQDGIKHWDELRNQLMLTRDELRSTQNEVTLKDRRIADLTAEIAHLHTLREADRNECVSLRTTLQNLGSMLVNGLNKAEADRVSATDAAGGQQNAVTEQQIPHQAASNIEDLVGRLANQSVNRA